MEERRDAFRRHAQALIAAGLLAGAVGAAQACELPAGTRLESKRLELSYRTIPPRIKVGEHFALEFAACPKPGAALPERIKLDAWMPEHKHGMNYRPDLKPLGAGSYRSDGWLFHMPGRWEFVFDLGGERLTHSVRIE
ncbi:MAG TPA: hypothetical protein VMU46_04135 [Burkholderiales bacterium]|nr:hypothetical protein [Burkholderiales bacterium]